MIEFPAPPQWMAEALCAEIGSEFFFPEKGGSTANARAVCAMCPVTAECLQFAVDEDLRIGIYGGLSGGQRRKLREAKRDVA